MLFSDIQSSGEMISTFRKYKGSTEALRGGADAAALIVKHFSACGRGYLDGWRYMLFLDYNHRDYLERIRRARICQNTALSLPALVNDTNKQSTDSRQYSNTFINIKEETKERTSLSNKSDGCGKFFFAQ